MDNLLQKIKVRRLRTYTPPPLSLDEQLKRCSSPFTPSLPAHALSQIENTIQSIYEWSRKQDSLKNDVKNHSVLMAYDFHLDHEKIPRLIEINTNASGFLIVDLIQKTKGMRTQALESLYNSFINEWKEFSSFSIPPQKTAIVDEDIENQKNEL